MMIPTSEFKPYQAEKTVTVTIFKREAVLIYKLRKISFGKIMVHKLDGKIARIEPTSSELINEEDPIEL